METFIINIPSASEVRSAINKRETAENHKKEEYKVKIRNRVNDWIKSHFIPEIEDAVRSMISSGSKHAGMNRMYCPVLGEHFGESPRDWYGLPNFYDDVFEGVGWQTIVDFSNSFWRSQRDKAIKEGTSEALSIHFHTIWGAARLFKYEVFNSLEGFEGSNQALIIEPSVILSRI